MHTLNIRTLVLFITLGTLCTLNAEQETQNFERLDDEGSLFSRFTDHDTGFSHSISDATLDGIQQAVATPAQYEAIITHITKHHSKELIFYCPIPDCLETSAFFDIDDVTEHITSTHPSLPNRCPYTVCSSYAPEVQKEPLSVPDADVSAMPTTNTGGLEKRSPKATGKRRRQHPADDERADDDFAWSAAPPAQAYLPDDEPAAGVPASLAAAPAPHKNTFPCTYPDCSKSFAQSGDLKKHMRIHTGERPFECTHPGCGKAFAQSGQLTKHILTHTGERAFTCQHPGCGKAFAERGHLTVHMRIHAGERPFECEHPGCGKSFAQCGHLTAHMHTHTGEKPFKCSYPGCIKAFAQSGQLTTHMRTHTGERAFACQHPGCGKAFAERGNLIKHMRTHTGERPFACTHPACGKAFTRFEHLTNHRKTCPYRPE